MRLRFLVPALAAAALVLAGAPPARAFSTVVIDPGHGGHDRGGIPGQRIAEKAMALDVGLRLRTLLETAGLSVKMTRDDDTFIPLEDRPAVSNEISDSIFVSIHFDAYKASHAEGVTTFWYRGGASRDLAASIQRQMVRELHPDENRGVQRRELCVLRLNRRPAVLVEGGYLTSPIEGAKILTPEYRQAIAQSIADGIADFKN